MPALATNILEVRSASPPTEVRRLNVPPFNTLYVVAGAAPVGVIRERLPDIVAVGVPVAMLMIANFAESVDVPPIAKSTTPAFAPRG